MDALIHPTGTNNLTPGDTIISDLQSAFDVWVAAGKPRNKFFPATIRPFGAASAAGSAKALAFVTRNQEIRDFSATNGLVCIDLAFAYCGD